MAKKMYQSKKDILSLIKEHSGGIRLDLGCGDNKQPGFIGLDIRPTDEADIVHNVEEVPYPLPDECCSAILASHLVEHLKPWLMIDIFNEWWRIMKPGGQLLLSMPYGYSSGFLQDPTHCFSDDTEILTSSGWKLIKDVHVGEKCLTLNENGKSEYQDIQHKIHEDFEGKMVHFKTKRMDLLVTKNHDMFYSSSGQKTEFKKERADNFLGLSRKSRIGLGTIGEWEGNSPKTIKIPRVSRSGNNAGEKLNIEFDAKPFMSFLGWYISEGCTFSRAGKDYKIIIYQSKEVHPENYDEIVSIIKVLGFKPQCRQDDISFSSKDLYEYLQQYGKDCYSKKIPQKIKSLSKELLLVMLDSLIKGDGRVQKSGSSEYATTSKTLADDVQEIVLKCGFRSTLYSEKREGTFCKINDNIYKQVDIYLVGITKPSPVYYGSPKEVDYKGKIACVTVPNHLILVRRNGRVIWSGNCNMCNEDTWTYFDPKHFLYEIYKPKPWNLRQNSWYAHGNMEVIMNKLAEEEGKKIYLASREARKLQGVVYGKD